MGMGMGMV
jgi:hypothetical protein